MRFRRRWLLWLIPVLLLGMLVYVRMVVSPTVRLLSRATVENRASNVINDAIEAQLQSDLVDYESIITLEKDLSGNITALKTNINQINRLKTEILSVVDGMLLDLDVDEIGLPLGSLIVPELFSGSGPRLPLKILSVSSSDADFRNEFSEAGINQSSHRIMMDVQITLTVLTPVGTESISVTSSVVVAETVIVGNVPNSYVRME